MDAFDYLAVLISIILGLGIAQLLTGFGRWIEQRHQFQPFGPAILWTGVLLLLHVQTWWSMFGLRLHSDWNFLQFSIVLLQPSTLYLLAILVLPGAATTAIDLRSNYFAQRHWFFGLLIFLLVVSIVKDLIVAGAVPGGLNLGFHAVFFAIAVVALLTMRDGVHRVLAMAGAVAAVTYVGLLFQELQ